ARASAGRGRRRGRLADRCRRQPLRRLGAVVGPADRGPRAPGGGGGGRPGGGAGHVLRDADGAGGGAGGGSGGGGAVAGDGPVRVVGHRGDDERGTAGARVHRPLEGAEVRGRLPRARGRAAGAGGVGT